MVEKDFPFISYRSLEPGRNTATLNFFTTKLLYLALNPVHNSLIFVQGGTYKTCIDDKGFTTCGYYDFTLTNDGPTEMEIIAKVIPYSLSKKEEKNEQGEVTTKGEIPFKHLKFVLYDRTGISGGI